MTEKCQYTWKQINKNYASLTIEPKLKNGQLLICLWNSSYSLWLALLVSQKDSVDQEKKKKHLRHKGWKFPISSEIYKPTDSRHSSNPKSGKPIEVWAETHRNPIKEKEERILRPSRENCLNVLKLSSEHGDILLNVCLQISHQKLWRSRKQGKYV